MKVEKEIFYHAHSGNKVSIGDILVFNSSTNNKMYEEVYNKEYKLNQIDANELLCNKKRNKEYDLSLEELDLILNTVNNDAFVMRELALEEVRKKNYPDYPSRLKCLYVAKDKEEAVEWVNILKRNKKECKQVLTLELTGDLFIGDGSLMKRQNLSYQKHLENAHEYWSCKTNTTPEYLFYGEAKVIDIDEVNKE